MDPLLTANDSNCEQTYIEVAESSVYRQQLQDDTIKIAIKRGRIQNGIYTNLLLFAGTWEAQTPALGGLELTFVGFEGRESPSNYISSKGLCFPFATLQLMQQACRCMCESCKINSPLHACCCSTASLHCSHWKIQTSHFATFAALPPLHTPPSINHHHC